MMCKNIYFILFSFCFVSAQDLVSGTVYGDNPDNPLPGANVYWLLTDKGTVTDIDGKFSLQSGPGSDQLIISYVGYITDTLTVRGAQRITHILQSKESEDLDEVVVSQRKKSSQLSFLTTQNVLNVSSEELLKAACCNLSESFETNPAIDVNFDNALTGVKQVQMMGLPSPYLLFTEENIPIIRGASQVYGLSFTPGTWIESLQITKGAGSVINGYESMTGQINAELKKPLTSERVFLNLFRSLEGRNELNFHTKSSLSPKLSANLFVHYNERSEKIDKNKDGFLDMPLSEQVNILSRFQYLNPEKGLVSFLNIRFLQDDKIFGQTDFDPRSHKNTTSVWGSEIVTNRYESSLKIGYVFPDLPYQSFGVQLAYSDHSQESYFGLRTYDIRHKSGFANLLFNSILGNTLHKFKTGIQFAYDAYDELIQIKTHRIDNSVGAFFEYSYDSLERFNMVLGLRFDHHNKIGSFITPRAHLRYAFSDTSSLRFSAGSGRRVAAAFAENQKLFGSGRTIQTPNFQSYDFGLAPEHAWNYGVSYLKGFQIGSVPININADLYRTEFVNQVVVDWETLGQISFYNLSGESYANSLQLGLDTRLFRILDARFAFKYYDVQVDYSSGRIQKPLQPKQRYFMNLGYISNKWRIDATYQHTGSQRVPPTVVNPNGFESDAFGLINAQLTYIPKTNFEIYMGAENLNNERQAHPILSADQPFSPNFDSSLVYAPVFGRMMYVGLRYNM
ncbi:MAG: TonB-dependent receptor [Flavobacteriaceae bacterium]|nr:TonB-dependent receptor [Flavobacteriaceae bacterium]